MTEQANNFNPYTTPANAANARGASMGRSASPAVEDTEQREWVAMMICPPDEAYDKGGAYWGLGMDGRAVYRVTCIRSGAVAYTRAESGQQAEGLAPGLERKRPERKAVSVFASHKGEPVDTVRGVMKGLEAKQQADEDAVAAELRRRYVIPLCEAYGLDFIGGMGTFYFSLVETGKTMFAEDIQRTLNEIEEGEDPAEAMEARYYGDLTPLALRDILTAYRALSTANRTDQPIGSLADQYKTTKRKTTKR